MSDEIGKTQKKQSGSAVTKPANTQNLSRGYDLAPRKDADGNSSGAVLEVDAGEGKKHLPPLGTSPDVAKAATRRYGQTIRDRLLGTYVYAAVEDYVGRKLTKVDPKLAIGMPLHVNTDDGKYLSPTTGEVHEAGVPNGWVEHNLLSRAADILEASHDGILKAGIKLAANIPPLAKLIHLPSPKPRRRPPEMGVDSVKEMNARSEKYHQIYSDQSLWDIKQNGWEYQKDGVTHNKSLDAYIDQFVSHITFNQTEGTARGYGEQNIRVSSGFAMMGTGDYVSKELFEVGGNALSYVFSSKEKRQEKQQQWKDNGGLGGALKTVAEESFDHVFRGHLSDWNVGLFYVYAKEAYMRENGPLDTPEKYQYVMRRAFTVYNLYVELVHNTGYDYLKDLLTGESNGQYSQYKERHAHAEEELNAVQRGWNGLVDTVGFFAERGTQMFLTMQAAVTTFGSPRHSGLLRSKELNQRAKLKRGDVEGEIFNIEEAVQAREIMAEASAKYQEARKQAKSGVQGAPLWPNVMDYMTTEERILVDKYKIDYKSDDAFGQAFDDGFEAFAAKVEKFTQNPNNPVIKALSVIADKDEDKGHYVQRMMNDAFGAYGGYSHYIANKRAGMMVAQDSNLIRQVTNAATFGVLDKVKFGRALNKSQGEFDYAHEHCDAFAKAVSSMRAEQGRQAELMGVMQHELSEMRSQMSQIGEASGDRLLGSVGVASGDALANDPQKLH